MKKVSYLNIGMVLLSWLSLPLLGEKSVKRFILSSLFMSLYIIFEFRFAEKRKWWWFPISLKSNFLGGLPIILGPFLIGSMWILKFTYGKFNLYLLVNILVDSLFTYFGMEWFKKIGYASLVRLTKFQLSLVFLIKSFVLYGFQVIYEKFTKHGSSRGKTEESF